MPRGIYLLIKIYLQKFGVLCQNCIEQSVRSWFYQSIEFNPENEFNKFRSYLTRGPGDSNPIIIIDHLEDSISLWREMERDGVFENVIPRM